MEAPPRLSTTAPPERIASALRTVADCVDAMRTGARVGRVDTAGRARLAFSCPRGILRVLALDDGTRDTTTTRLEPSWDAPVHVVDVRRVRNRGLDAFDATAIAETIEGTATPMHGAVPRPEGTEPPCDVEGIARAFALMAAAWESHPSRGEGAWVCIRPHHDPALVYASVHCEGSSWRADAGLHALIGPLCAKASEIVVRGVDDLGEWVPLASARGTALRLEEPGTWSIDWTPDPVGTMRTLASLERPPLLVPTLEF